jgi:hypothetical protein
MVGGATMTNEELPVSTPRPAAPDIEPLRETIESIVDGWYPEGRIDWEDFLDRLEAQTDTDLGDDLLSPTIKAIKAHAREYRKGER